MIRARRLELFVGTILFVLAFTFAVLPSPLDATPVERAYHDMSRAAAITALLLVAIVCLFFVSILLTFAVPPRFRRGAQKVAFRIANFFLSRSGDGDEPVFYEPPETASKNRTRAGTSADNNLAESGDEKASKK